MGSCSVPTVIHEETEDDENGTFDVGISPSSELQNSSIDDKNIVRGVLYNQSIRSGFASLCLHPLKSETFIENTSEDDESLDDYPNSCVVRIQFGQPLSSFSDKNIVPFLRSHVRRYSKLGDLLQISGGKYSPSDPDNGAADSRWDQLVDRYVLTLDSLKQAAQCIHVVQPRYWNIRQVQSFQHKYVPSKQSKQSSISRQSDQKARHTKSRFSMDESAPFTRSGQPINGGEEECHAAAAGHNTSLAKRIQSSCVANFLMNAIQEALHSSHEDLKTRTMLHNLQDWAACPPRSPSKVQDLLNEGTGVLDIAGGSGYVGMALGLRGVHATVLDPRKNVGILPKRDRKLFRRAQKQSSSETTTTMQSSNEQYDILWKNLLFPAQSMPKAPPPSSATGDDQEAVNECFLNQLNSLGREPGQSSGALIDSYTQTRNESPVFSSPLDTSTYDRLVKQHGSRNEDFDVKEDIPSIYFCKPVQTFDSYRAWFGGMPPQIRDVFHGEHTDALPVCNKQDETLQNASALVALHPDEATDAIVDLAVALKKPFAIIPCCVYSRFFPHRLKPRNFANTVDSEDRLVRTRADLLDYLQAKHSSIQRAVLPFEGANTILWSTFDL